MTPESKEVIIHLIENEIRNVEPVMLHYEHQLYLVKDRRILDLTEDEMITQLNLMQTDLRRLKQALKEFKNDNP